MGLLNERKTINRLNQMIDNAINGSPIEQGFDESRLSALETKLSDYLAMNSATKIQLAEDKAKINELISDISHQTKTPLSNILLYTQLLVENNSNAQDRDLLKLLMEQAEKLNFLISSLVKTSRLETGIIAVAPKKDNVLKIVDAVIAQATPKSQEKGVLLTADACDIDAVFDLKWTIEALNNIVDNALKYTPSGGSVTISIIGYQLFCCINVQDTGIGISEDEVARIFLRFYRSREVRNEDGVGIGLYLAREIISNQGGYIKVKSSPNKGSTFSVFLPLET